MGVPAKPQQAVQPSEAFNASNARQVAERERESRSRSALEALGLANIMGSAESRAYIYGLLEKCGVFRSSFTGNSETFMREGQRNVGLMIMADLMRNHAEAYLVMVREAQGRGSAGFRPRAVKTDEEGDA